MGAIWGRQDPGGPHVGPKNFVIWDVYALVPVKHPCHNFNGGLIEPQLELGHGWVIAYT